MLVNSHWKRDGSRLDGGVFYIRWTCRILGSISAMPKRVGAARLNLSWRQDLDSIPAQTSAFSRSRHKRWVNPLINGLTQYAPSVTIRVAQIGCHKLYVPYFCTVLVDKESNSRVQLAFSHYVTCCRGENLFLEPTSHILILSADVIQWSIDCYLPAWSCRWRSHSLHQSTVLKHCMH